MKRLLAGCLLWGLCFGPGVGAGEVPAAKDDRAPADRPGVGGLLGLWLGRTAEPKSPPPQPEPASERSGGELRPESPPEPTPVAPVVPAAPESTETSEPGPPPAVAPGEISESAAGGQPAAPAGGGAAPEVTPPEARGAPAEGTAPGAVTESPPPSLEPDRSVSRTSRAGDVQLPTQEIRGEIEKPDIFFLLPKARSPSDEQLIRARLRREITRPLIKDWVEEELLLK